MIDPVCGMKVDPANPRGGSFEHGGVTYAFCSPGCRQKFMADPEGWLKSGPKGMSHAVAQPMVLTRPKKAAAPANLPSEPSTTWWVCPMDPEIRQRTPGDCPICGMALEPDVPTASATTADPELANMTRRLWVASLLTLPLLVLTMGGVNVVARPWIELALATPVCLWAGWPFFVRAFRSVRTWNLNMFTLIGLGVGVAFLSSIVGVVAPGVFPPTFRDGMGHVPLYF